MKNKKEKVPLCLSMNKQLFGYVDELISNKSKYIEYLIYEELKKNNKDLKKIILGL